MTDSGAASTGGGGSSGGNGGGGGVGTAPWLARGLKALVRGGRGDSSSGEFICCWVILRLKCRLRR